MSIYLRNSLAHKGRTVKLLRIFWGIGLLILLSSCSEVTALADSSSQDNEQSDSSSESLLDSSGESVSAQSSSDLSSENDDDNVTSSEHSSDSEESSSSVSSMVSSEDVVSSEFSSSMQESSSTESSVSISSSESSSSSEPIIPAPAITMNDFTKGSFSNYPYRSIEPAHYSENKEYPIILFAHGAGGSGTDNVGQFTDTPDWLDLFGSADARTHYPAFIVAPQNPIYLWDPQTLYDLLEDFMSNYNNIDRNRIYITGLSMGGNATWRSLFLKPDYYAAAIPICGWFQNDAPPNNSEISKITDIPIWAMHSDDDNVVAVTLSRTIISQIRSDGGAPIYSEYTGWWHESWKPAYDEPGLIQWLFSQNLQSGTVPSAPMNVTVSTDVNSATLSWTLPASIENTILHYNVYKDGTLLTNTLSDLSGENGSGLSTLLKETTYTDTGYNSNDVNEYAVSIVNYRQQESDTIVAVDK
ncbi:MAG: hypothetical protein OCD76_09120 [Reichenbachiella sp.]